MAINNFKPFALDPNANVTSQADWEALPALLSGFTAGKASSAQVNKAIRQASFIAAALAQYTANKSRLDVLDDGDLNGFISKMGTAFGKDFQALDATLSALAGLATGANKLPYFTGNDTAAQTDLTSVGRDIIGKNTIADILTYLGIKEASTTQVGLVRLTSSRVSGAEDIAATANAVAQNYTDIQALQGKTNDATPTNKGIIRVSDSRTSTESGVAASSLAVSQNYSDMKGLFGQCGMKSRNLGVVYTNSQSFAIFVSVNAVLSDGSSFLSANVNVDGNSANFRGSQTTNLAGQRATIAFMVPAGATYIVQQFSGTVSGVTWVEVDKK
ncbi:hypothetical protein ACFT46_15850 [Escherichia coli]